MTQGFLPVNCASNCSHPHPGPPAVGSQNRVRKTVLAEFESGLVIPPANGQRVRLDDGGLSARVRVRPGMAHRPKGRCDFVRVSAVVLARKRDELRSGICLGRECGSTLPLRIDLSRRICAVGHRNEGRSASTPVFAGVEALGAKGVGDERLAGEIQSSARAAVGIDGGRDLDGPGGVFAAERDQMSGLCLVVIRAACSNAVRSEGGNALPRFPARRKIPSQAFALK